MQRQPHAPPQAPPWSRGGSSSAGSLSGREGPPNFSDLIRPLPSPARIIPICGKCYIHHTGHVAYSCYICPRSGLLRRPGFAVPPLPISGNLQFEPVGWLGRNRFSGEPIWPANPKPAPSALGWGAVFTAMALASVTPKSTGSAAAASHVPPVKGPASASSATGRGSLTPTS
jgi:hypothetical protein